MQHAARRLLRLPLLSAANAPPCRQSIAAASSTVSTSFTQLPRRKLHSYRIRSMSSSAPHPAASEAGDLASGTCEPCRRSTPLMPADEHDTYLRRLNDGNRNPAAADEWHIEPFVGSGNVAVLQKSFTFRNFAAALRFVNRVGEVAEAQKHHPEIVLGWGHVEVAWWSHAIGGLHKNDFVCAAKTDQVLQDSAAAKTSSA